MGFAPAGDGRLDGRPAARAPIIRRPDARAVDDPRRLGLGGAAIVAGYAVVVGLISAAAGANDPDRPKSFLEPSILACS